MTNLDFTPSSHALTVSQPKAVSTDSNVNALYADWLAALGLQVASGELSATTIQTYQRGMAKASFHNKLTDFRRGSLLLACKT